MLACGPPREHPVATSCTAFSSWPTYRASGAAKRQDTGTAEEQKPISVRAFLLCMYRVLKQRNERAAQSAFLPDMHDSRGASGSGAGSGAVAAAAGLTIQQHTQLMDLVELFGTHHTPDLIHDVYRSCGMSFEGAIQVGVGMCASVCLCVCSWDVLVCVECSWRGPYRWVRSTCQACQLVSQPQYSMYSGAQ